MSAFIERNFEFLAGVHFNGQFTINEYNIVLAMDVNTDSIREQNVAMGRIKYLIQDRLEDCVFVNVADKKSIDLYTKCGIDVCVIPEEPYDQIIALVLLLKSDAITENKLLITDIEFTSRLSDGVKFKESIETARTAFDTNGWWADSSPSITNTNKINKKDKVVQLVSLLDWKDLGLGWVEKTESVEIIFSTVDDIGSRN